jgi:hypothetical protein
MAIATDIERLEFVLTEALSNEWEAQGHQMTGAITKDIEYVVKQEVNKLTLSGMIYPYGNIQAAGAKWKRFPNVYAIQEWVKKRMSISDEKKSKSIAFAIAQEFKKHGMPLAGSYQFSKTGKRTDWIEEAFKHTEDKITEAISAMAYNQLSVNIDVLLTKWNLELNKTA